MSHTTARNARLSSLEQGAAMDRTGEEDDEFTDALSQQAVEPGEEVDIKDTGLVPRWRPNAAQR